MGNITEDKFWSGARRSSGEAGLNSKVSSHADVYLRAKFLLRRLCVLENAQKMNYLENIV
jgi:hypothetical protein